MTRLRTTQVIKAKGLPTQSRIPLYPANPKLRKKPVKEIYRSNSVMNIEIEKEMATLEITVVPEKHFKDLMSREVNHIQTLKTFVVPAKVERIKGRTIIHKAIIFYQSDSTQSLKNPDHDTWKKWVIKQESENTTSDDTASRPFERRLYELDERAKCLRDISKMEAKCATLFRALRTAFCGVGDEMRKKDKEIPPKEEANSIAK
jgi:hypothetical protein